MEQWNEIFSMNIILPVFLLSFLLWLDMMAMFKIFLEMNAVYLLIEASLVYSFCAISKQEILSLSDETW